VIHALGFRVGPEHRCIWKSVIAASLGFAAVLAIVRYGRSRWTQATVASMLTSPSRQVSVFEAGPRDLDCSPSFALATCTRLVFLRLRGRAAWLRRPIRPVLSFGAELAPCFLARYLQDLETQRAWLDLSWIRGLEVGAVFAERAGGPVDSHPGLPRWDWCRRSCRSPGGGPGSEFTRDCAGATWRWRLGASGGQRTEHLFRVDARLRATDNDHIVDVGDRAPVNCGAAEDGGERKAASAKVGKSDRCVGVKRRRSAYFGRNRARPAANAGAYFT